MFIAFNGDNILYSYVYKVDISEDFFCRYLEKIKWYDKIINFKYFHQVIFYHDADLPYYHKYKNCVTLGYDTFPVCKRSPGNGKYFNIYNLKNNLFTKYENFYTKENANSIEKQIFLDAKIESFKMLKMNF